MIPPVPPSKSRRLVYLVTALCVLLMVALGATGIALIQSHQATRNATSAVHTAKKAADRAKDAAMQAKQVAAQARALAQCVNDNLGDRAGATQRDAVAHIDHARAQQQYDKAFALLLVAIVDKKPAATITDLLNRFVQQAQAKAIESVHFQQTLSADQAFRIAHPLGEC